MMTNEQILELAETCGFDGFQRRKYDGKSDYGMRWECWEENLIKFAQAIRAQSFADGYDLAIMDYIRDESNFTTRTTSND